MKRTDATALLGAIRRAGDQLAIGLGELREANPDDLNDWEMRTARALSAISEHLLEPLLTRFPEIAPDSLGGPAAWRPARKKRQRK